MSGSEWNRELLMRVLFELWHGFKKVHVSGKHEIFGRSKGFRMGEILSTVREIRGGAKVGNEFFLKAEFCPLRFRLLAKAG